MLPESGRVRIGRIDASISRGLRLSGILAPAKTALSDGFSMEELNPLLNQIKELKARADVLRGYL